ncbi:hypothetical protein F383_33044 [Gossypium arboreum]|uniref:Uncharacterized protein n=1 Tax=Gossypium arboreum TaxID=29729 RepID=A0A0B0PRG9_GOSAR|nr:hypothetical protein F383_33044 [Gossypium arboreum]
MLRFYQIDMVVWSTHVRKSRPC